MRQSDGQGYSRRMDPDEEACVVPDDIVADVLAASPDTSKPSPSGDPADKVPRGDAPAQ
jgi:hypothetical protein